MPTDPIHQCLLSTVLHHMASQQQHYQWQCCCRRENGSLYDPPMETSFGHWNTLLSLQDENPIIGRICAGNLNIWLSRCLPNRDVISSLNPPNSHDPNGGTYVWIGGLLKEKKTIFWSITKLGT